jgi:hypothetical protein
VSSPSIKNTKLRINAVVAGRCKSRARMAEIARTKYRLTQDVDIGGHSFHLSCRNCCGLYYSFAEVHFAQASIVLDHVLLIRALQYPFRDVPLCDTSVDTTVPRRSATWRVVIVR